MAGMGMSEAAMKAARLQREKSRKSDDPYHPPKVHDKDWMLQREKYRQSDDPYRPAERAHGRDGDEGGGHEGGQVAQGRRHHRDS